MRLKFTNNGKEGIWKKMRRGTLADNHDVLNNPITDDKKMLAKILINHFLIAFFSSLLLAWHINLIFLIHSEINYLYL